MSVSGAIGRAVGDLPKGSYRSMGQAKSTVARLASLLRVVALIVPTPLKVGPLYTPQVSAGSLLTLESDELPPRCSQALTLQPRWTSRAQYI